MKDSSTNITGGTKKPRSNLVNVPGMGTAKPAKKAAMTSSQQSSK